MIDQAIPDLAGSTAPDAGWTLIETLVALALLGLIAGLLGTSLMAGRQGLARLEAQDSNSTLEAVQRHIRRELAEARSHRLPGAAGDAPIIEATTSTLRFVSHYGPAGQFAGVHDVALQTVSATVGGNSVDLVEQRSIYHPTKRRAVISSTLLRKISKISFSYFGVREEGQGATWGNTWLDPTTLPQLVSVQIEFPAGDRRNWPAVVVGMQVGH